MFSSDKSEYNRFNIDLSISNEEEEKIREIKNNKKEEDIYKSLKDNKGEVLLGRRKYLFEPV